MAVRGICRNRFNSRVDEYDPRESRFKGNEEFQWGREHRQRRNPRPLLNGRARAAMVGQCVCIWPASSFLGDCTQSCHYQNFSGRQASSCFFQRRVRAVYTYAQFAVCTRVRVSSFESFESAFFRPCGCQLQHDARSLHVHFAFSSKRSHPESSILDLRPERGCFPPTFSPIVSNDRFSEKLSVQVSTTLFSRRNISLPKYHIRLIVRFHFSPTVQIFTVPFLSEHIIRNITLYSSETFNSFFFFHPEYRQIDLRSITLYFSLIMDCFAGKRSNF